MTRGSLLPDGMKIEGEIRGQGDLVIAGVLEGPIQIDGHLTIEATGVVKGEIKARALIVRGLVQGAVVADETIRLEQGAKVVGDARADRVMVALGAHLRGRITMTGTPAPRRTASGTLEAPRTSPGTLPSVVRRAPLAAPEERVEETATNRFVRPTDLPLPLSSRPLRAETPTIEPVRSRGARKAPEPVIPGVGRQRARRKDGGSAT